MIPSLLIDLTSILTAVSTITKDLKAIALKSTINPLKRSITIPHALSVTT